MRFGPTDDNILGTLKIGDWGLASMAAVPRKEKALDTTTKYGTPLYEPPDVRFSRQDDVWSMGCIILEIIIWLLYGYYGVKKFRSDLRGCSRQPLPYYVYKMEKNKHKATLRPIVFKWLDHMADKEPRCSPETALGALLNLVGNRLLIVELIPQTLPQELSLPPADSPTPRLIMTEASTSRGNDFGVHYRATSVELLTLIQQEVMDDEDYWLKADGQRSAPDFNSNEGWPASDHLTVPSAHAGQLL